MKVAGVKLEFISEWKGKQSGETVYLDESGLEEFWLELGTLPKEWADDPNPEFQPPFGMECKTVEGLGIPDPEGARIAYVTLLAGNCRTASGYVPLLEPRNTENHYFFPDASLGELRQVIAESRAYLGAH